MARRVERQAFGQVGRGAGRHHAREHRRGDARDHAADGGRAARLGRGGAARRRRCSQLRERCLKAGADLPWAERGAILTLLGSAERAFFLIERIDAERRSVSRYVPEQAAAREAPGLGGAMPVPAE